MLRRDAGHFYQVSDYFWKVIIIIIAYMVPPYGKKGREEEFFFLILLKDSHHGVQIMSQRDVEDEFLWEII